MKLLDAFPPCQDRTCPEYGTHKHPTDSQLALINSTEKYVLAKGGVGSGKTLGAAILGVMLSLTVPGNRGFVGRKDYDDLHDSTLRTYLEVIERLADQEPELRNVQFLNRFGGFPHRVVFPNASEIIFRETKDPGKFLGADYGWFHLDEVSEMDEAVFKGLMTRLRLPRAGRHLKGILTTNPPHEQHWLVTYFGKQAGVIEVPDPEDPEVVTRFRHISSSTRENRHLPRGYLRDLLTGLSAHEIERLVEGNFGVMPEGPAAFPEFRHEHHVGVPEAFPNLALIRSWDFGFRHPAASFHQNWKCKAGTLHVNILAEVDAKEVESEQFARIVLAATDRYFPNWPRRLIFDTGDYAGTQRHEKGPGPIIRLMRPPFNLVFRVRKIANIEPGLDLIRKMLRQRCPCGMSVITIHRRCHNIINAFAGGYHYKRDPGRTAEDRPVKDGFYDDFMDTVRYQFENFVRYGRVNIEWADVTNANPQVAPSGSPGWAWLQPEPTAEQVAAEIQRVKQLSARLAT